MKFRKNGISGKEALGRFRDEIEFKIKDWSEHPEEEFEKLKAERERREQLMAARREAESREAFATVPEAGVVGPRRANERVRLRERRACA